MPFGKTIKRVVASITMENSPDIEVIYINYLTKRHDTEEIGPQIMDFAFNECLAITLIRSDKKIRTIQLFKSQLIVLIKYL